jgi:2-polyprenyl-6-methoxyphenol hydroxylase-like FAD-dependent oxidoreductase
MDGTMTTAPAMLVGEPIGVRLLHQHTTVLAEESGSSPQATRLRAILASCERARTLRRVGLRLARQPGLIASAPAIYEYPMIDRDPLPRWGSGRVSLLGDAAHPMYPIGSNGASQAIIDARVLAHELAGRADPVSALTAYEHLRRPPTTALVYANRRHGPEQVMTVVEERAPDGFAQIDDVIGHEELRTIVARYSHTAGFDVDELNSRSSWNAADVTAPT